MEKCKFYLVLSALILVCSSCYYNNPETLNMDGECHFKQGEYEKALGEFRKAAELGNLDAHFALGKCYANGIGVKRDLAEAAHFAGGTTKALLTECREAMKKAIL